MRTPIALADAELRERLYQFARAAFGAAIILVGGCSDDRAGAQQEHASPDPTSQCLTVSDLQCFQLGRSMRDILEQLNWRHGFVAMAECGGTALCSITFGLRPKNPGEDQRGATFEAIFENDRFSRFVLRPPEGPWPTSLGDCEWLQWALVAKPESIDDLQNRTEALANGPSHVDWGLTMVWMAVRPFSGVHVTKTPTVDDYTRNAALREQFDAARLELGVTEAQVEAMLRSKPLESGVTRSGAFAIYGSRDRFNIDERLHFWNVLVVFREGRACVVESIGAEDEWKDVLEQEAVR